MQTGKSSKCRPGHQSGVSSISFDEKESYLASIGLDGSLIIYNIGNADQPVEMFQFKIAKLQDAGGVMNVGMLSGSFNKNIDVFYAPGMKQLQIIQLLNNKWQHRVSKFVKHSQLICLVKMIKVNLMVTSSANEFVIWNNRTEEKLVQIENLGLNKIIEVGETFWAAKNDGRIFCYKKILVESLSSSNQQQHHQRMEIEDDHHNEQQHHLLLQQQIHNNADVLTFDDQNQIDEEQNQDAGQINQQDRKSQLSYHSLEQQKRKKSKADRLITAYPQPAITTQTSIFDSSRYLYTSNHGYLIERIQNQYDVRVQFEKQDKQTTELLFINKKILFADINSTFITYANQTQYGVKFLKTTESRIFDDSDSWEKQWEDVVGVACAYNWVAVANDQAIKVFDILGNQLKTISFDRIIVAMSAYENLLAVVYHQTIPIDGSQCLSMQLYLINSQRPHLLGLVSTSHVPISPKSVLKYFRFSSEGMLLTQDDAGWVRAYSLEHNSWVPVVVENVNDTRRIWLLGMKDYKLVFWKTSEINPDPQVFPRLPVKQGRIGTTVAVDNQDKMREYPFLMFQRFALDHEKCRFRLWGHLKTTLKQQKYPGYKQNLSTILSLNQINQNHNQLDYKFFEIIKFYLENVKTHQKALMAAKTMIRTLQAGKNLLEIFDQLKLRPLAVDLEIFFDQKEKELQYELMQKLALNNLKAQAEINIKPKQQNNPFNKKKNNNNDMSSIPSLNVSQVSQSSNFDTFSEKSSGNLQKETEIKIVKKPPILQTPQKEQFSNPFMKKKFTEEDANQKARQIEQQIEKYGIKKKVDINKRSHKQI